MDTILDRNFIFYFLHVKWFTCTFLMIDQINRIFKYLILFFTHTYFMQWAKMCQQLTRNNNKIKKQLCTETPGNVNTCTYNITCCTCIYTVWRIVTVYKYYRLIQRKVYPWGFLGSWELEMTRKRRMPLQPPRSVSQSWGCCCLILPLKARGFW